MKVLETDFRVLGLEMRFAGVPLEDVFRHFTEPELLTRWWPQKAEVDASVIGAYRFEWPAMNWVLYGVYTAFEPDRRVEFTWQWEHEPDLPPREVDILFEEDGDGTKLTLAQGGYGRDDREQADRNSHIEGWTHFLSKLQALLETRAC